MESKGKNFKRGVLSCKGKDSPDQQKSLRKAARNLAEVRPLRVRAESGKSLKERNVRRVAIARGG